MATELDRTGPQVDATVPRITESGVGSEDVRTNEDRDRDHGGGHHQQRPRGASPGISPIHDSGA